jgi:hypothetical protein
MKQRLLCLFPFSLITLFVSKLWILIAPWLKMLVTTKVPIQKKTQLTKKQLLQEWKRRTFCSTWNSFHKIILSWNSLVFSLEIIKFSQGIFPYLLQLLRLQLSMIFCYV